MKYKLQVLVLLSFLVSVVAHAQFGPGRGAGNALSIDSGGHAVMTNMAALSNNFTFEAWIRVPEITGFQTILSRGGGSDAGSASDYALQVTADRKLALFAVGAWHSSPQVLPPNQWMHVAVSFDGGFKRFFVNGAVAGVVASPGQLAGLGPEQPLYIGRQGSACNCNFFAGEIDEVRIWNVTRSFSEIADWSNRSLIGNEPGLVAYYRFDEFVFAAEARDSSAQGRGGSLVGSATRVGSGARILSDVPRIESFFVTQMVSNEVILEGKVSAVGWDTGAWYEYRSTTGFAATTTARLLTRFETNSSFSVLLANLPTGTYEARLWATNAAGTNASTVGAFTIVQPPPGFSNALALSSIGHVTVTNPPVLSDAFTFEAWVRLPDTNGYYTILSRGPGVSSSSPTDYIFQVQPGGQVALFAIGAWDDSVIPLVIPGEWTHLAVTFDGATKRVYRNGVPVGGAARAGALQPLDPAEPLYLGRQGSACHCNFFNGEMEDVRVWNVARSEQEIRSNLNQPLVSAPPGLVAYYRFDEPTPGFAADSSGQDRLGLITGPHSWAPSGAGLVDRAPIIVSFTRARTEADAVLHSTILTGGPHTIAWYEWGTNGVFSFSSVAYEIPAGLAVTNLPPFTLVTPSNWVARVTASNALGVATAEIHIDVPNPLFIREPIEGLLGGSESSVAWGDFDGDDRLDFLVVSFSLANGWSGQLWRNTGTGFSDVTATVFPAGEFAGLRGGAVECADYNRDGRLDFLVTGSTSQGTPVSQLWRNTVAGFTNVTASEFSGSGLPGVVTRDISWCDYDSDGRPDLLLSSTGNPQPIVQLWRNTGQGFIEVSATTFGGAGLPGLELSDAAWGDYDNDGRVDLFRMGQADGVPISQLWRNTGHGFTNVTATAFPPSGVLDLRIGSVAWGDFDNDGLLDFIQTGMTRSDFTVQLWKNTGAGFVNVTQSLFRDGTLTGVFGGSVEWGDYDNDGRLDFLLTGSTTATERLAQLWRNTPTGFVHVPIADLPGVTDGDAAWGDYDQDGRLDFLMVGNNNTFTGTGQFWRNLTLNANSPPTAPTGLAMTTTANGVMFSWNAATDAQTPASGLSYNVRAGTTPGGAELLASHVNPVTGFRRVPAPGNAQMRRFLFLNGVTNGQPIYWSVQAVDTAFAGGPWADEASGASIPHLAVTVTPSGLTRVSWTPPTSGWLLQQNSDLTPTGWRDAPTGETNPATIPATGASRFFRLRLP